MRCTTAGSGGTAEPTWPTANNGTVTCSGGVGPFAVFTNVTGQSTYGWSAAAGDLPTLQGGVGAVRFQGGDRMFVASDHTETQTAATIYGSGNLGAGSFNSGQVLSVNRAGSVPPVAADLLAGATVTVGTGNILMTIEVNFPTYQFGMNYIYTGSATIAISLGGASGQKGAWFDTCTFYLNTATTTCTIRGPTGATSNVIFWNTTVRFGATGQSFAVNPNSVEILWINTPSALAGATFPTTLFPLSGSVIARGVDLSALTGTLTTGSATGNVKILLDSCKIAAAVTRYTGSTNTHDLVELVNCYDGTNFISERWQVAGSVTTEFTITLTGGATDNVGTFSHKMVSGTSVDKYVNTLDGFWLDVNNVPTGSGLTATVEIVSSASLNNDEISLILEYEGTASSSVASFVNTQPVTVLTANGAVTTSTAGWNSSPATPVYQKIQAAFTPNTAGRVRALVRLGKASTTVYVNPQVTVA